jgi:hypothetical protein
VHRGHDQEQLVGHEDTEEKGGEEAAEQQIPPAPGRF